MFALMCMCVCMCVREKTSKGTKKQTDTKKSQGQTSLLSLALTTFALLSVVRSMDFW